jgi:plasmid stabilization system protein ParE
MACKVNWTTRAWLTFETNLGYLQKEWTAKEISNFITSIDKKISIISRQPEIGKSRNKKHPHIRFTVIHKRVALIYKYKPQKNEIDLLVFWNTYRNPGKLNAK